MAGSAKIRKGKRGKAVALDPGYAEAYRGMGLALEQKGDFQSALQQYQTGCVQLGGLKCCDLAEKLAGRLHH
jgi:lipoprotein NlpI